MRVLPRGLGLGALMLCPLMFCAGQNPPSSHVVIPNPTPRPPDLQQQYGDNPKDQKRREALLVQNQLRGREIWLESNQILLLAQQLEQEIVAGKKSHSMSVDAAKAAQIEKLAQSVQEKMKIR